MAANNPPSETTDSELSGRDRKSDIPVVGLGGSAGSIEALQRFFQAVPESTGMAYVVILHLSPDHESTLAEILQRCTAMPVAQVTEDVKVAPDHVYVIPPGKHLKMRDGCLGLTEFSPSKGTRVAVDGFFRTLADTHGPMAAGVVLSGIDGDGALGLKRIKERGGLAIAQDPAEAQEKGMPETAITAGVVDWILEVAEMPSRIVGYYENGKQLALPPEKPEDPDMPGESAGNADENEKAFKEVLKFLKARTGRDFSSYKRATILRRLGRRMQINSCHNIREYLDHLRNNTGEASGLLQDLLISVTNFFRDPEAFAALQPSLSRLLKNKETGDEIRVWVAACATGEEAYSIAILLDEIASQLDSPPKILIFATDIDRAAIDTARHGKYPETITTDVSEERLRNYFTKEVKGYRIRRSVRETVLFAPHDALQDPPFSRLDLICCRNLLIYLNRDAQSRVFETFHFALRPGGILFLGQSETVEEMMQAFGMIDKKHRVYECREGSRGRLVAARDGIQFPSLSSDFIRSLGHATVSSDPAPPQSAGKPDHTSADSLEGLHFRLANRHMPPSVIVNRSHEIIHLSDQAGELLQPGGGSPSVNLIRMVQPELRVEMRSALFRAEESGESVETARVPVKLREGPAEVSLEIHPAGASSDLFLVIFRLHEKTGDQPEPDIERPAGSEATIRSLEEQLDRARGRWKECTEQHEVAAEELQASNEELQATNEEMHAAAEELETGREELQSMNEELSTVNLELKDKVEQLSQSNSDLHNLMAATNIATIFLDKDLRISRYTPSTVGLFNLIPSDIGRPLSDQTHHLVYPSLAEDARKVFDQLQPLSREVRTDKGRWYLARLLPYRTTEDNIGGVVFTCVDITAQKEDDEARRWLAAIVESSNDAIISFSMDGKILSWNQGAERIFGYTGEEIKGRSQAILAPSEYQQEKADMLEKLRRGESISTMETVRQRKDGRRIHVSLSASVMFSEVGEIMGATAIVQDVTSRKQAVIDLQSARHELEEKVEERTLELKQRADQLARMAIEVTRAEQRERQHMARLLHDHVQQLLVSAKMHLEAFSRKKSPILADDMSGVISVLDEVLESSRSLASDLSPPVLKEGLVVSLEWLADWVKGKHGLEVHTTLESGVDADGTEARALVFMAIREVLFNVVKHAGETEAFLTLEAQGSDQLKVMVRDHGQGFDPDELTSENPGHSGMGLRSMRERLSMIGGSLELLSTRGKGVKAAIIVPRAANQGDAS